jgi:hypothetical protein
MNLLDEYKNGNVVGFSFSPIDYIEEKIMLDEHLNEPDQAPLRSLSCLPLALHNISENGILEFDSKRVILKGDQIFEWLTNENFKVHVVWYVATKSFILKIHDDSDAWEATFYVPDEPVELSL